MHRGQDLVQRVVRLEEAFHKALRGGDFDRIARLSPQAEQLELQLLEILEDPGRSHRQKEGLRPLLEIVAGLHRDTARLVAQRSWRYRNSSRNASPIASITQTPRNSASPPAMLTG